MIAGNIAKRYARAFFDVAGGEGRYEGYYDELKRFSSLLEENANLRNLLLNPIFEIKDKKAVIRELIQELNLSLTTANFINLLVDKRRIGIIREIEKKYRELMDDALGIARVQVRTAFPLTTDLSAALKRGLESFTGKHVDIQVEEDASLLGGIVVRVGDKLYDSSIKMQLNNMMKLLGEET